MTKIKVSVRKVRINKDDVYNGKCKLIVQDRNFMKKSDIKDCISMIYRIKNVKAMMEYLFAGYVTHVK